MMLRKLSRTAVEVSLRVIRLPIDGLLAVGGDRGSTTSMKLVLDRADARTRELAGLVLADPELREDAELRREAINEREKAVDLRAEAKLRSERADRLADERKRTADRSRAQAASTTRRKRQQSQQRRQSVKATATQRASQRKNAAKSTAARTEKVIEEQARNSRLEQLGSKQEAVQEKEAALAASEKAQRLGRAAGAVKEKRKSGD